MTGKIIGYIRVSTIEQKPDRQLENVILDKKFIDYASAKSTDRPQLKLMLEFAREDDTIIVHSMDRLARNLKDLKDLVDSLVKRNITVLFIKENLEFSGVNSAMSNLILHLMGAFAEFEYAFIKERQREGMEIAKRKGNCRGGKKKLNAQKIEILKSEWKTRKPRAQIAEELGISRSVLYTYIRNIAKEEELKVSNDRKNSSV